MKVVLLGIFYRELLPLLLTAFKSNIRVHSNLYRFQFRKIHIFYYLVLIFIIET